MAAMLSVAQVADRLSVSKEFVRNLIRTGELKATDLGSFYRIEQADLDAYLKERTK